MAHILQPSDDRLAIQAGRRSSSVTLRSANSSEFLWSCIYTEATGCAEFVGWLINKPVFFSQHHKVVLYKMPGSSLLQGEPSSSGVWQCLPCVWAPAFTRGQGKWSMSVHLAQERAPTSAFHLYFWMHKETEKQLRSASNVL